MRARRLALPTLVLAFSLLGCPPEPAAPVQPAPSARKPAAPVLVAPPDPPKIEPLRVTVVGLGGGAIASYSMRLDGRVLAVGRGDRVEIWDVETGTLAASEPAGGAVTSVGFPRDGATVHADAGGKRLTIALPEGLAPAASPGADAAAQTPSAAPETSTLKGLQEEGRAGVLGLEGDQKKRLVAWIKQHKARSYEQRGTVWIHSDTGPAPRVSLDGKVVVVRDDRDDAYLRVDTGKTFKVSPWAHGVYQGRLVRADPEVRFGPSSDVVLALSATMTAPGSQVFGTRLYDTRTGKQIANLTPMCRGDAATWAQSGATLVIARCKTRNAFVAHDAATGRELARLDGVMGGLSADGKRVVLRDDSGSVVVRSLPGGARVLTVPGEQGEEPSDLALRTDRSALYRMEQASVSSLSLVTGERRTLVDRTPDGDRIAWDSAERVFTVATDDGLAVVDTLSHSVLRTIPGTLWDERAALSPDGKTVLTSDEQGKQLTLWPIPEGKPRDLAKAPHDGDFAAALAWSDDARLVAVAWQPRGEVDVYDAQKKRRLRRVATGNDKLPEGSAIVLGPLAFVPGTHALFIERFGRIPPADHAVREIARVDADTGRTLLRKEINEYPKPALFRFARDGSALFTWEVAKADGAERPGVGVYDIDLGARSRFVPLGPDDGDFRRLHVPRLLADLSRGSFPEMAAEAGAGAPVAAAAGTPPVAAAARTPGFVDALAWAVGKGDSHEAVTLSADGALAIRARPNAVTLVRRSDGAELRLIDGVVGRTEVSVVVDAEGHFDGPPGSLLLVRASRGDAALSPDETAALHRTGLLQAFLAAAK